MGLETGVDYIDDLVITNPTNSDDPSEGDDHLRNIKKAVKQSFSAITGEVTATQAELNFNAGVTAGTVTASKAVVVDASKDVGDFNEVTAVTFVGNLTGNVTGNVTGGIVGELRMWPTGTAPTGWLISNGGTLGNAASGADYASDDYETLFDLIKAVAYAVGGYTNAGSEVFANGDTIVLPDFRGRIPIGAGTGDASDATAHAVADKEGAETHTLTEAQMPSHQHYTNAGASAARDGGAAADTARHTNTLSGSAGGDDPHNNLQPSLTINFIIKY